VILEESGERAVGKLVRTSHVTIKGEHQFVEYFARLDIAECAKIFVEAWSAATTCGHGHLDG
jgi:hypothetical protein